jgi:hypothetical protein
MLLRLWIGGLPVPCAEAQVYRLEMDCLGGEDLLRRPSATWSTDATVLRILMVTSPRTLIASVETGSFSRRMEGGIRRDWRIIRPGAERGVSSGKGYARYEAGLVVRRDLTAAGDRRRDGLEGTVGSASSLNSVWPEDAIVVRW